MDPDESHLRKAAHCMVRNLTSGLAMITCREQVCQILVTNLKQNFLSVLLVRMKILTTQISLAYIISFYLDTNAVSKRND